MQGSQDPSQDRRGDNDAHPQDGRAHDTPVVFTHRGIAADNFLLLGVRRSMNPGRIREEAITSPIPISPPITEVRAFSTWATIKEIRRPPRT
jgi:hypothetical protein